MLLKHGRVGLHDGPGSNTVAWMEARTYDGGLVGRWPIERGDTTYRGEPVAAHGASFFLVSSSASDYPIIRELRVVEGDEAGP